MKNKEVNKKIVFITGTNGGFGWLTTHSVSALGHKVYATMRDTDGKNAEKAKLLSQVENVTVLDVSLTDESSVKNAFDTVITKEGAIDVLVNNAGIAKTGVAESFTTDIAIVQPGAFPTEMAQKSGVGSDTSVVGGYEAIADFPNKMVSAVGQLFETIKPNPQDVADALVKLISLPKGQRPLRTVVDPATGEFVKTANDAVQVEYIKCLTAFGMKDLLP